MPPDALSIIRPQVAECGKPNGLGLYHFDARGIDRRFRHAALFAALGALNHDEAMRYYDDHDPVSLLVRIAGVFGAGISVSYVLRHAGEVIIDMRIAQKA